MAAPQDLARLLISILILSNYTLAWTFIQDSSFELKGVTTASDVESALSQSASRWSDAHTQARTFVRSLASAPSCTRQAALGLIENCSGLASEDQTDSYAELDAVKSLYSARLAICEMRDAGLSVPSQCNPSGSRYGIAGVFGLKPESKQAIAACVQALETRPQSWTSYSNNRQNAILVCRASREEREREEQFATMKKFVDVNEASQEALSEYLQFVSDKQSEQQALASEVQAFQKQQMDELLKGFGSVLALVEQVRLSSSETGNEFNRVLETTIDQAKHGARDFLEILDSHRASLRDADLDLATTVSNLQRQGKEMSHQWSSESERNSRLAVVAQDRLARLSSDAQGLHVDFDRMHEAAKAVANEQIQTQQSFATHFGQLELRTAKLADAVAEASGMIAWLKSVDEWSAALGREIFAVFAAVAVAITWVVFGSRGIAASTVTITILCIRYRSAFIYAFVQHSLGYITSTASENARPSHSAPAAALGVLGVTLAATMATLLYRQLKCQHRQFPQSDETLLPTSSLVIRYYHPESNSFEATAP